MAHLAICIIAYILIGIFSYNEFISKKNLTKFEKFWFSVLWITLLPLYCIRKIQELFI